jgi:probable phosphoglycerate mutase
MRQYREMLWLIRHGETAWSLSGAHTGRTDIPLTAAGEEKARTIGRKLAGQRFALVLSSPLQRARRTCEIAGFGAEARIDADLLEWDYGSYEGRTTAEIRRDRPDWFLFRDGVPGGETIAQVAARAGRIVSSTAGVDGNVALFAHGHILRIIATCWLELPPEDARLFMLDTAGVSTLGYEHETRVITRWNL